MQASKNNRVIVRVWTSEENKQFPGHNVGHISLETPQRYMSFWPMPFTQAQINEYKKKNILEQKYLKYFMPRDSNYMHNYEEDFKAEGNQVPQVVLCFYSLKVGEIEQAFEKLIESTKSWRLIGSNLFVQKLESVAEALTLHSATFESNVGNRSVENCASFALKLLKAGGITKLVSFPENSSFASQTSSSVSPDKILDILIPAKQSELKKHPETKTFSYDGETSVEIQNSKTLDSDDNSMCLVM